MKSISLEGFIKVLSEDDGKSFEKFFKKLQSKSTDKKEIDIEEVKQLLHTAIDKLKNEKDLRLFCLKMGETIFEYFREVVIPKEF